MNAVAPIPFDNSYTRLPERFYSRKPPAPVKAPHMIRSNAALAQALGIDITWLASSDAAQVLSGNRLLPGSEPIATVYGGHQFGSWNPQLGDGRAILLGELLNPQGQRFDIQLKGAGQTPYSRMGDGRSPLGPVLREYIVSEAMAALGIPTTRSLAAVASGEYVFRNAALPGAVLTRVARSHIRVGHFEYFASREDTEAVRALADHVIARDFPDAAAAQSPYIALLDGVIARQAALIAKWQLVGFIHGVMNTDNMLLCGETIDYGPCAFMDTFDPDACFSSIDHGRRYAYKNQPVIAQWNLSWFAQSLLPLIDRDEDKAIAVAQQSLNRYPELFDEAYSTGLHHKFGFSERSDETRVFIQAFMDKMVVEPVDFTLCFRHLADRAGNGSGAKVDYQLPQTFNAMLTKWETLLGQDNAAIDMSRVNPAYIPRNHLVEEAIQAAQQDDDFAPFHRLVDRLANPWDYDPQDSRYAAPPAPDQVVTQTFCGT
ncbi:MAG: YdiU family protein [Porticoccaceae bacterium]